MTEYSTLSTVLIEAASFISASAAIAAGIIMAKFLRKFVTGILAKGFKTIGIGIFIVAVGIIIDAVEIYTRALQPPATPSILSVVRQIFFVVGTFIIVIGSKTMGDQLETLSKHKSA